MKKNKMKTNTNDNQTTHPAPEVAAKIPNHDLWSIAYEDEADLTEEELQIERWLEQEEKMREKEEQNPTPQVPERPKEKIKPNNQPLMGDEDIF